MTWYIFTLEVLPYGNNNNLSTPRNDLSESFHKFIGGKKLEKNCSSSQIFSDNECPLKKRETILEEPMW